ncbi:phage baseplate assembly protein V [Vibrio coralliilyticus]|uniref:phage baseplate assembly protein V n=1 Tax=Vibrio TaxID=662 RepID=UPI00148E74EA|nr:MULTISPECIES: phage baseplate assembly protein V [Vibrio]NOH26172.1 phage baseplate assembly protein V [Vibrio europaeus]NOH41687.1 phage baseplate assembly protein V [Vibrio coralliilyticus]
MSEWIKQFEHRLERLERKVRNLVRVGNVKALHGRHVVIDYEPDTDNDYYSSLIPWLPIFAGDVLQWRAPTIGETMIVINLSGGETESDAIALPAMYCDAFQPDDLDPLKTYTRFLDVFRVETDSQGNHRLFAKNSIEFVTKTFTVNASDSVNVKTATYNRTAVSANTDGKHTQTGQTTIKGNTDIKGALDVSVSIKTPAIASYAAGAFAMNAGGATISNAKITSCRVNGKLVEGHTHTDSMDGEVSPF